MTKSDPVNQSPRAAVWIRRSALPAAMGALAVLTIAAHADAQQMCDTLPQPVIVSGSTVLKPLLGSLAPKLAAATPSRETVVFVGNGSCPALNLIASGGMATGAGSYWDATGALLNCTFPPTGLPIDVAVSDVFAPGCGVTLPSSLADFVGAVDAYAFVVPVASTQTVISANAAYFTFGFGAAGMVNPWNDPTQFFIRGPQVSSQIILADAIGVPVTKWQGVVPIGGSGGVVSSLASSTTPQKAIGILGADIVDAAMNRTVVKELAFQPSSTSCGVLPDSASNSFDKANVRNGTYGLWGREHYVAQVDASGNPVKPGAADLVGILRNTAAPPAGFSTLDSEISAHLVPQCAMKVSRSSEMGPLTSQAPADPCGCYFTMQTTGATSCTACTTDATCAPAGKTCHHGFCE